MSKLTKAEVNKRLKAMNSPIRVIGDPNGTINKIKAKCSVHKYTYEPYLGNLLKGCACPKCKTDKAIGREGALDRAGFTSKLLQINPEYRLQYYNGIHKPCKVNCLKCGTAQTQPARNFLAAPCQTCKAFKLEELKKDRTKAYRLEVAKRKAEKEGEYVALIKSRLTECEHVNPIAEPYKKNSVWRVKTQCKYCDHVYHARVDNLFAGTKCKKCAMRWAKNKDYNLGSKTVQVQGYEPQALDYIINKIGIKAEQIEVDRVPMVKYRWGKRLKRYYPDFFIKHRNIIVEVKSVMTLGVNKWYGKGKPPFEQNQEKHKAVLASGYRFKLLVVSQSGAVYEMPKSWLAKTKDEVKAQLPFKN